uniref:APAF1 interacting protein n=1 Tax=Canis lupus familiaris TaxID=9615 RepID=A0A8C0RS66_CANLF
VGGEWSPGATRGAWKGRRPHGNGPRGPRRAAPGGFRTPATSGSGTALGGPEARLGSGSTRKAHLGPRLRAAQVTHTPGQGHREALRPGARGRTPLPRGQAPRTPSPRRGPGITHPAGPRTEEPPTHRPVTPLPRSRATPTTHPAAAACCEAISNWPRGREATQKRPSPAPVSGIRRSPGGSAAPEGHSPASRRPPSSRPRRGLPAAEPDRPVVKALPGPAPCHVGHAPGLRRCLQRREAPLSPALTPLAPPPARMSGPRGPPSPAFRRVCPAPGLPSAPPDCRCGLPADRTVGRRWHRARVPRPREAGRPRARVVRAMSGCHAAEGDRGSRGCGAQPEDMFVCDINEQDISGPPPSKNLKKSQCTPLFMNAYTMRGAGAVIHTHSKAAVMATLLFPGREFKITHQEMIKGIRKCTSGGYYRYDDMLVVPIIENTPEEKDLKERMARAINEYPDSCAVLVRRHGVYVWGETWEKAKTMVTYPSVQHCFCTPTCHR